MIIYIMEIKLEYLRRRQAGPRVGCKIPNSGRDRKGSTLPSQMLQASHYSSRYQGLQRSSGSRL